jgi:hypothetical protein
MDSEQNDISATGIATAPKAFKEAVSEWFGPSAWIISRKRVSHQEGSEDTALSWTIYAPGERVELRSKLRSFKATHQDGCMRELGVSHALRVRPARVQGSTHWEAYDEDFENPDGLGDVEDAEADLFERGEEVESDLFERGEDDECPEYYIGEVVHQIHLGQDYEVKAINAAGRMPKLGGGFVRRYNVVIELAPGVLHDFPEEMFSRKLAGKCPSASY